MAFFCHQVNQKIMEPILFSVRTALITISRRYWWLRSLRRTSVFAKFLLVSRVNPAQGMDVCLLCYAV